MSSRPLSPHLQVYRWQITMVMSILHRATGVALSFGLIALVWWLAAAATSAECLASFNGILNSWFGTLCLLGFTFSAWYHLLNGIRHLGWDFGFGFSISALTKSGLAVAIASAVLTLITFVV